MAQKWHLLTTLTFKNLMLKLAINIDRLYRCMFFIIEVPLGEEIHIQVSVYFFLVVQSRMCANV